MNWIRSFCPEGELTQQTVAHAALEAIARAVAPQGFWGRTHEEWRKDADTVHGFSTYADCVLTILKGRPPAGQELLTHRGDVLPLLSGQLCGDESNIKCPHCGSDYTHIERAGTVMGSDPHEAKVYPGTVPTSTTGFRRSGVEIVMSCEMCPFQFALVVQQHKGNNFVQVHRCLLDHQHRPNL